MATIYITETDNVYVFTRKGRGLTGLTVSDGTHEIDVDDMSAYPSADGLFVEGVDRSTGKVTVIRDLPPRRIITGVGLN